MTLFCRLGLHTFDTIWSNVCPRRGGGPMYVREQCEVSVLEAHEELAVMPAPERVVAPLEAYARPTR